MCWRQDNKSVAATHKVGEEILPDAPPERARTHNLTQYVCCYHFFQILGIATHSLRGCAEKV